MDFISIASTKAFAEIVFTMNTVRRLKTAFIRAVQSCVSGTVASRMYTLEDAIAALKTILGTAFGLSYGQGIAAFNKQSQPSKKVKAAVKAIVGESTGLDAKQTKAMVALMTLKHVLESGTLKMDVDKAFKKFKKMHASIVKMGTASSVAELVKDCPVDLLASVNRGTGTNEALERNLYLFDAAGKEKFATPAHLPDDALLYMMKGPASFVTELVKRQFFLSEECSTYSSTILAGMRDQGITVGTELVMKQSDFTDVEGYLNHGVDIDGADDSESTKSFRAFTETCLTFGRNVAGELIITAFQFSNPVSGVLGGMSRAFQLAVVSWKLSCTYREKKKRRTGACITITNTSISRAHAEFAYSSRSFGFHAARAV